MICVLIKILCKWLRLISQNPIGINVELYYGIISEENLWKGFGLDWMVMRSGRLMCNYPQSYKISFILLILYYIKPSRKKS